MGLGASIFLIAVGAVLAFAVNVQAEGFNVNTIGVILMIVGALGLLASMVIFGNRGDHIDHVDHVDHVEPGHHH